MAQAWFERVRRSTPWRCWARGMQVVFAGVAVCGAAVAVAAVGAPVAIVKTMAVFGVGVAIIGFASAYVSMVILLATHREMFNAHGTAVSVALARDLFRLKTPPPFAGPPWPPPQWRPAGTAPDTDQPSGSSAADG